MRRPIEPLSRRDLLKSFGLAALFLQPTLRSMAYAAETPYADNARFVMFFKGGSFYPSRTNPKSLTDLAGTPLAPLSAHADDLILFKGMNIHGGSPKSNGYKEEHAAGVYGCATGNSYKYFKNDAYFAYTDHESIDVRIARDFAERPGLKDVPLASLHVGGGAHSDADNVGVGNRFISFRERKAGDARYGNAIEPMQDSGAVFDLLMRNAGRMCQAHSNRPATDRAELRNALGGDQSVLNFLLPAIRDAERTFSLDKANANQLEGLMEGVSELEKSVKRQARAEPASAAATKTSGPACTAFARPNGDGANKKNLDILSPVHDQMIDLIKLAFQLDLTRVVAFTLSGGSSGQSWPSHGIHQAHHTLEHSGNVDALVKIDTYYAEKFARLLTALKSVDDGGGKTALNNSSVMLGMECWSNSSSGHYLTNIPFVFAGQGGGAFKTGRIVDAHGRNNNDLHLSCLKASGISDKTFGLANLCQGPII